MSSDLPPEIIEKIVRQVWYSCLSPDERILCMTACPRLSRTWRSQYARIASTTIHIPCMNYLLYLAEIIRTRKSLIYDWTHLRTGARSIICFLDLRTSILDYYSYTVWHIFAHMGNYIGIRTCFPSVQQLSFETVFLPIASQPQIGHTQMAIIFDRNQPPSSRRGCLQLGVHFNVAIYDPFRAGLYWSGLGPLALDGYLFLLYFYQIYHGVFHMENPPRYTKEDPIRDSKGFISNRLLKDLQTCGIRGDHHICASRSSVFRETSRMEDRMGINHYLWLVGLAAPEVSEPGRNKSGEGRRKEGFFHRIALGIWNRLSYWSNRSLAIILTAGPPIINLDFGTSYQPKFEVGSPHHNQEIEWWVIKYSDGRLEPSRPYSKRAFFRLEQRQMFLRV
ncbi:hypothetical protein BDP27DRAFT_1315678 [Rhodocollybia butyracea]|uniref:F-box domain-containing protein n=1 Tax=Rhodocollybia butyracea TaxID=206335 RepID=A0A9P5Q6W4_9AGAR|nr:hypothetical protein BDP27DRAFT_1315678 [Rhodocollybia butyracea]